MELQEEQLPFEFSMEVKIGHCSTAGYERESYSSLEYDNGGVLAVIRMC